MKTFVAVCMGGAAGTGARYLVNLGAARWIGAGFPAGTLTVNVVGSFLLAAIMELSLHGALSPEVRLVLGAGVMGGFTTYSSFNYELLDGVQRGAWLWSCAYLALTVVGCIASGGAGVWLARAALGRAFP